MTNETPVATAEQIAAAAEVARREAPAAMGQPQRQVVSVKEGFEPYVFTVDLGDDWRKDLLVLDGHVVTARSLKNIARYLKLVRFLERHVPEQSNLVSMIELWGEPPPGFSTALDDSFKSTPDDQPGLAFHGDHAIVTLYCEGAAPSPPGPPFRPLPQGRGAPPRRWLRAQLRIDKRLQLKWSVEQRQDHPGAKWTRL